VERKGSLNEVVGNFTSGRERFAREFERLDGQSLHMVIEDATWKKIVNGSYRSEFSPKSLTGSILGWSIKYDFKTWLCTKEESPLLIYSPICLSVNLIIFLSQSFKFITYVTLAYT